MNFEDRIERLTERHEALAQTVELFALETRDTAARIEALIRENEVQIKANSENIGQLVEVSGRLVRTAEMRERRIKKVERRR